MSTVTAFAARRTLLGLEIELSVDSRRGPLEARPFVDDIFSCTAGTISDLLAHLRRRRSDLWARLESGQPVKVFVPAGDPIPIRVTTNDPSRAYFNFGELSRWLFLKNALDYPFKAHQRRGVDWLQRQHAGILADDMGLGKTLQAVAALERLQCSARIAKALVLCPKSLIGVWEAEISLWAPRLCTVALYSSVSERVWESLVAQSQVVIANYESIRQRRPRAGAFDLVIYDEIHKLKNPASLNYSAAYALQPRIAWGLTGTPLENESKDLVAILHLLDRKRVGMSDRNLPAMSLRSLAGRYTLRRDKSVIADELPEILERIEPITLSAEQKTTYRQTLEQSAHTTLGAWIATFNRLRDICDLDPSTGRSSKIDRAIVILKSVRALGQKAVVFSWRIEPLRVLQARLTETVDSGEAALLTGRTRSTDRSRLVRSFQTGEHPSILLCSMRAAGEGLTLTAANHVIFLNEWWNPSVNAQARDRVNRIGQSRDVFVHRLRTTGTVESRLEEILQAKSGLFEQIVNRLSRQGRSSSEAVPEPLQRWLAFEEPS